MGFQIEASELSWIGGARDDPEDLCLHGKASVAIGDRRIESYATVSATALTLLKTLTEDHIAGEGIQIQMLPCCGHFWVPNDALDTVEIIGCDYGADWTVRHDGDTILLELDDGITESVPLDEYRQEVFRFADRIEAFYQACSPKKLPEDEWRRAGYLAFWTEWRRRRNG